MSSRSFASGLGRPIDWRYASNRFGIVIWAVSMAVFLALAWWGDRFSYLGAVAASVGVFLAWAIGRELDPAHTSVAGVASVGAIGIVFLGAPAALVVFGALLAVRAIAGTTGRTLRWGDLVGLAVAGFASGGAVWSWSIAIVLFAWLKGGTDVGGRRWWGMGALGLGFVIGWYLGNLDPIVFAPETGIIAIAVLGITVMSLVKVSAPGRTDAGKHDISVAHIRLARAAGGIVCLAAVVLGGTDALIQIGPLVCALAATAVIASTAVAETDRTPT